MLWLAVVMFVALALAVLRGGRLTNLADIRLKLWWLLPLSFALQLGTRLLPERSWTDVAGVAMVLGSYVPLIGLVFANRDRKGMWLAGIGVLLNFSVILLNGGMPVLSEAALVASGYSPTPQIADSYKHITLDVTSRLPFLADVIPMRIAGQGTVLSLGDVFLAVGLARFLEAELRRPVRWFKPGVKLSGGSATRR
ncbi:MAG: DUF5317 domain-containing protein [Acidimicrobiia bacterium]|nr:DUF5317 domain-containing protein [Acidimicrobiia bacterium]MDH4306643.1 DUF5317 domain-containing protein [Acidimicrobiia bacterium]